VKTEWGLKNSRPSICLDREGLSWLDRVGNVINMNEITRISEFAETHRGEF